VAPSWTNQKISDDVAGRLRGAQLRIKEVNFFWDNTRLLEL
jgi:hypothetical protein